MIVSLSVYRYEPVARQFLEHICLISAVLLPM
jgi:hypothetical protein